MYANMVVVPTEGATLRPDAIGKRFLANNAESFDYYGEQHIPAYEVIVRPDGSVRVQLDGQDGGGSYAEHAGHLVIEGGCRIVASF
jgi:hypothetical protein